MPSSKQDIRFIGIDGGGTKTACMIGDGLGNVLAVCYGASSSIKSNSSEAVQDVLLSLIQQALELSDSNESQLRGVFLGLAGADRPEDKVQILSLLEGKLPASVVITLHNDAITALSAGTWGEAGIVLISGTGSIAYGFVPEASIHVRVGGWGYLLGDEGSGFDMGQQALIAVMKQHDGRGPITKLTAYILEQLSLTDPNQIVTYVYGQANIRTAIAVFSKVVLQAAKEGDGAAMGIADRAAGELAQIAITAQRQLQHLQPSRDLSDLPLLLSGGLFSDPWFQTLFESQEVIRTSSLKVSKLEVPPVTGCYVLALKQAGIAITDSIQTKIRAWETRRVT